MKKLTVLLFTLLLIGIFSTQKAEAFVQQYSPLTPAQVAPSGYSRLIDGEGRYFFYRLSSTIPYPVMSYEADGSLLFQSVNVLSHPLAKFSSDDTGNFHSIRTINAYPTNYQTLSATKVSNSGAIEYFNKPIIDSKMSHSVQDLFYNYNTDSLVLNIGEYEFGMASDKFKSVMLDEDANPITAVDAGHVTNPYSHQYCSNKQAGFITVPYDVRTWKQCWDWCEDTMDATYGLCQYNGDALRNCWVNESPIGGVNNCVWEDWPAAGWPPFTGYLGMPAQTTEAFDLPFYAEALAWPQNYQSMIKEFYDGSDLYYDFYLGSVRYVQKISPTGQPLFSGSGINLADVVFGDIIDVVAIDEYLYVAHALDVNPDSYYDTLYIQKIDSSGNTVFPGFGLKVYQNLADPIDLWSYLSVDDGKLLIAISAYETVNWEYSDFYYQVMTTTGELTYPTSGKQFLDYETDNFKPYSVDGSYVTASGEMHFFVSGYNVEAAIEEIRLFVPLSDGAIKYEDLGLIMNAEYTYGLCSEDLAGNMSCLESDDDGNLYLRLFDKAYQIRPSASFTVIDSIGRNISTNKTHGVGPEFTNRVVDVDLVTPEDIIVVELTAQVNVDQDWSTVEIDLDATLGKMFVTGLDGAPGVLSNRTVYVPIIADSTPNKARFCPNAASFGAVTADCAGGFTYESGNANASMVEIEGLDYWKIENLGQDGGFISYFSTAPVDDEETPPPADDEIPPVVVEDTDINNDPPVYPPVVDETPDEDTVVDEPTDESTNPDSNEDDNDGVDTDNENPDQDTNNGDEDDDENGSGFWADFTDGVTKSLDSIGNGVEELLESDLTETITVIAAPILYMAISPIPVGVNEWFAFLVRGYNGFLAMMSPKKKLSIFGYVYDSVNKSPLSLAVIRFFNKSGALVMTSVTNPFGRFNIDLPTDSYKAVVSHTSYKFPSTVVKGEQDAPIANIYHGGFQVFDRNNVNTISVPMDSSEKHGLDVSLITAKSTLGNIIRGALWIMFGFGFIQSFYLLYTDFGLARIILALLYVLLTAYYIITNRKVSAGKAVYRGEIVSNLEVVLSKDLESGEILDKRFTDNKGNYNFVAVRGMYYLTIKSDLYELSKPIMITVDSPKPITIGATLDLRRRVNV